MDKTAPRELPGLTTERIEGIAAAVDAAWCKSDIQVRARRCNLAATALRQLAALTREQREGDSRSGITPVFRIVTAYESGVGKGAARSNCSNPYKPDTDEHEAWDLGRKEGEERFADKPDAYPQQEAPGAVAWPNPVSQWVMDIARIIQRGLDRFPRAGAIDLAHEITVATPPTLVDLHRFAPMVREARRLANEGMSQYANPCSGEEEELFAKAEADFDEADALLEIIDNHQGVKSFAAPGAWFPMNVLGNPMREFAPGKWETAKWPSDKLQKVGVEAKVLPVGRVQCGPAPHDSLYAMLLPTAPRTPTVKEGDLLYTTPPAPAQLWDLAKRWIARADNDQPQCVNEGGGYLDQDRRAIYNYAAGLRDCGEALLTVLNDQQECQDCAWNPGVCDTHDSSDKPLDGQPSVKELGDEGPT
jgi:hypothetical protein